MDAMEWRHRGQQSMNDALLLASNVINIVNWCWIINNIASPHKPGHLPRAITEQTDLKAFYYSEQQSAQQGLSLEITFKMCNKFPCIKIWRQFLILIAALSYL